MGGIACDLCTGVERRNADVVTRGRILNALMGLVGAIFSFEAAVKAVVNIKMLEL